MCCIPKKTVPEGDSLLSHDQSGVVCCARWYATFTMRECKVEKNNRYQQNWTKAVPELSDLFFVLIKIGLQILSQAVVF